MSDSSNTNETPDIPEQPTTEQPATDVPSATIPTATEAPAPIAAQPQPSRAARMRTRLAGTSRPTRLVGAAVAAVVLVLAIGSVGYAIGHESNGDGPGGSHGERHGRGPDDRGGRPGFDDRNGGGRDNARGNNARGNNAPNNNAPNNNAPNNNAPTTPAPSADGSSNES